MRVKTIPQMGRLSMYKVVLLCLGALAVISMGLSFASLVSPLPLELLASAAVLIVASLLVDALFRIIFRLPARFESTLITAAILFFVLHPTTELVGLAGLALAAALAVASKYLLAWRGRHLFNPAAFGALALTALSLAFPALGSSWWWVGTPALALPVFLVGVAILLRTEKLALFSIYLATTLVVAFVRVTLQSGAAGLDAPGPDLIWQLLTSGPYLFLGLFMLTEPLTLPPRRGQQYLVAALVGGLAGWPILLGPLSLGQEGALLIGNLVAFALAMTSGRRAGISLTLIGRQPLSATTTQIEFEAHGLRDFAPGQYLELAVPHKASDLRGTRREFSIVSAPSQLPTVKIAYRTRDQQSSYKRHLGDLAEGAKLRATGVWGDFVLPGDSAQPVLLVAGGIGITPFLSQLQEEAQQGIHRDCVLVYAAGTSGEVLFAPELEATGIPVLLFTGDAPGPLPESWQWAGVRVDHQTLLNLVPDLAERHAYVSGPPGMVNALSPALKCAKKLRQDAFSGY